MDNYYIQWLTWHWVIGLCLAVMCFVSVGIVIASVRAIDDDYYQLQDHRYYWSLVLFTALVFGTTMAIALLWNFQ
jgi:hypothetical protein